MVPRTKCETCLGELEPRSDCSCAPGPGKATQRFEPHLNTALPHVHRSRVPRSGQLAAGRVDSLHVFVVLCGVCTVSYLVYVVYVVLN